MLKSARQILFLLSAAYSVAQPPHLTPIRPYDILGYEKLLITTLIPKQSSSLWMLAYPNHWHTEEYAISLNCPRDERGEALSNGPYTLELRKPKQSILTIALDQVRTHKLRTRPIKTISSSISVDSELANILLSTWHAALMHTRYSKDSVFCEDYIYQFHLYSNQLYGQTSCPGSFTPNAMVELGEMLIQLVQSNSSKSAILVSQIKSLALKIISDCAPQS